VLIIQKEILLAVWDRVSDPVGGPRGRSVYKTSSGASQRLTGSLRLRSGQAPTRSHAIKNYLAATAAKTSCSKVSVVV
jgi:hypothetical protein